MRARPAIHCFGHIHEGWGAERILWSEDAKEIAKTSGISIVAWKKGEWRKGVNGNGQGIELLETNVEEVSRKRCVNVDLTTKSGRPLNKGSESLLVNAAIMDVEYEPVNAPWLIELDLPKA